MPAKITKKVNMVITIIIIVIIIIIIIITIIMNKNNVKRGQVEQGSGDMKIADLKPIKSLEQHNTYKFLGVFENTKQEDNQVLEAAAKTYLQRLSIIWSSPLSDHTKVHVVASNQYALPVHT